MTPAIREGVNELQALIDETCGEAGRYYQECPYTMEKVAGLREEIARLTAPFWTVAIYLEDLAYGGPEEGGWWYTAGARVDEPLDGVNPNSLLTVLTGEGTIYKDTKDKSAAEQEAHAYVATLQTQLDATVNAGRRETSSVLSEGRYRARAYPGHPPTHFPTRRPHYE